MTVRTHRGFTMVELMIALVLTLAVGGVAYQMLLRNSRVSRAQSEQIGVQDNVRSGALIITNELREVGYDVVTADATAELGYAPAAPTRTDLLAINPSYITYRATRGLGFVCQVTTAAPATVLVRRGSWQELRAPKTTDSLLLYVENQPNTANDDAWVHLGIVATGAQNCPVGGAGLAFQVAAPADGLNLTTALNAVDVGAPVRVTEVMRMEHYVDAADGQPYLGMRSISGGELTLRPVIGPLAANGGADPGLAFEFLDANNAATGVLANVRVIRVALRGVTDQAVYGRKAYEATVDTLGLTTRVALRNTLR
ncbi:MAG TPA: prepilin-type N-terminal cleavage/methylation domain-containing protein [Nonomuraea sp.]|nr:prepilin-type N-terminal cleavage/methylation domain-containing protein [Nonomuraea sp.]